MFVKIYLSDVNDGYGAKIEKFEKINFANINLKEYELVAEKENAEISIAFITEKLRNYDLSTDEKIVKYVEELFPKFSTNCKTLWKHKTDNVILSEFNNYQFDDFEKLYNENINEFYYTCNI